MKHEIRRVNRIKSHDKVCDTKITTGNVRAFIKHREDDSLATPMVLSKTAPVTKFKCNRRQS